jgi:hypothetical protein
VKDTYKDFRWRKYMVNLWARNYAAYRPYYAHFLCREWNRSHDYQNQVTSLEIIYMKEDTPPPGQPLPKAVPVPLGNWNCS